MSIYRNLGLEPIINACGSVTRLGGAPMPSEVQQAWLQAAQETVPLEQLHGVASRRIAEVTNTEAGLVTSGAAAALTLGAAAILTGYDLSRMEALPDARAFPHEFVVARDHRNGYDHAVRAAGVRFVEVGFNEIVSNAGVRRTETWEYEAAFGPQTAGVFYVYGTGQQPPLEDVVQCAHKHGLPVLVDAAGELPPIDNLSTIPATGADLVAFSGGKAIRGPQSSGILCGRRDLIGPAALQMLDMDDYFELCDAPPELFDPQKLPGLPRHGLGRALKVGKEEIVALLTALDLFRSGRYEANEERFRQVLGIVDSELQDLAVTRCIVEPDSPGRPPLLEIGINGVPHERSAFEVCRRLRRGTPSVYVGHARLRHNVLVINPLCVDEESATCLARRLREELSYAPRGQE